MSLREMCLIERLKGNHLPLFNNNQIGNKYVIEDVHDENKKNVRRELSSIANHTCGNCFVNCKFVSWTGKSLNPTGTKL